MKTLILNTDTRGVATLTFNRVDMHNAFDDTMIRELLEAFAQLSVDAHVRVIVLAAAGRSFCAGADLNWMRRAAGYSQEKNREDAGELALMLNAIYACPKPVIARVHGNAFGGGVGVIAAADVAISLPNAQFSLSEVKLGLIPAVISPYVIEAIGARNAHRYFLTAERMSAAEALRIGLLHEVVDTEEALDKCVEAFVQGLLQNGPAAMEAVKNLVQAVAHRSIDDALMEDTITRIAQLRTTPEAKEGLTAFLEKRAPSWTKNV